MVWHPSHQLGVPCHRLGCPSHQLGSWASLWGAPCHHSGCPGHERAAVALPAGRGVPARQGGLRRLEPGRHHREDGEGPALGRLLREQTHGREQGWPRGPQVAGAARDLPQGTSHAPPSALPPPYPSHVPHPRPSRGWGRISDTFPPPPRRCSRAPAPASRTWQRSSRASSPPSPTPRTATRTVSGGHAGLGARSGLGA